MDQEKVVKFIKEKRKKDGLTQEKFAEKYGVTYQTVSKWENGKSIPDILVLKQMCEEDKKDFSDLLIENNKNRNFIFIGITVIIIIIVFLYLFLLFNQNTNDFDFKKLSTTCDGFDLSGSIAYNDIKTSIYISNIRYCGEPIADKYKEIECILYESDGETLTKISTFNGKEGEIISLSEFLDKVEFNIEHYSTTCKMYQENGLSLEIKVTNTNNQTILYHIPVKLEENCVE